MNKSELIAAVAEKAGITKTQADAALTAITDNIAGVLVQGETITLPGFGTFSLGERAARTGRNPKTGEALEIAASRAAKFKQAKALKEALNAD
ncbi:HU family DNA-binding protein [Snodgrassella sp. CFCC 13594]|uniref:HU family DNA-binding protein n=1 Tax=Snodgrassella sp. CFCC 13594 TaxID=1775559 RepID=UPI0008338087|nr:HU family DNA-binding protein [Snodgrassella sp. CFCC 13594]